MTEDTIGNTDPGPRNDHAIALCHVLGIDPSEVTGIRVEIEAGVGAVVRWDSYRTVPLPLIADAIASAVAEDNNRRVVRRVDTATVPDPWDTEPPC